MSRNRTIVATLAAAAGVALLGSSQPAQDAEGKKWEGAAWYQVIYTDYHDHRAQEATEIIRDYFYPATQASGTQAPRVLEFETGPWDRMIVFELPGGPGDLEWRIHPDDVKWMEAIAEEVGSFEAAEELWNRYLACVARSETHIARERPRPWTD